MAEALSLRGVRAGYGATVVLEDISLTLPVRGTLAVLGRNGVGKSTLLATIMGHTTLHAGDIVLGTRRIERLPVYERARAGLGYVPQTREIFPSLTVEENLVIAARPGRWALDRIYGIFPQLFSRRAHMGNQISGVEQQMLAIGRALMGNPDLLLMDEPLEGLAPVIVDGLLKVLRRLIDEDALAIVLVEQSARLALEMTEQTVALNRGRIAYSGPSAALLADRERLSQLFLTQ
jgi:branched-chain amino acid transport system ATP-binding protein